MRPPEGIERHLTERELAEAIDEAQQAGNARLTRRLIFVKNLYHGDSGNEAGRRVGVSSATASRWVDAWNAGGVDGLRPSFGGGRPRKLSDRELDSLEGILRGEGAVTVDEVRELIAQRFDVSYSRRHVRRIVESMDSVSTRGGPE